MDRCPICGSELIYSESAGKIWYCSPRCGACFTDIDLHGWSVHVAEDDESHNESDSEELEESAPAS